MTTLLLDELSSKAATIESVSPVAIDLINMIGDPKACKTDIVKLVGLDEALNANVFKLVNSAAFSLKTAPRNLTEAINILGLYQLRNLVFLAASKASFDDEELWYRSVFMAYAAQKIARKLNKSNEYASDVYMAALMTSFGEVVFKRFYREEFEKIAQGEEDIRTRMEIEKETFGINHVELSFLALQSNGLPESVLEILRYQSSTWVEYGFSEANAIIELVSMLETMEFSDEYDIESKIDFKMLEKFGLDSIKITPDFIKDLHIGASNFVSF